MGRKSVSGGSRVAALSSRVAGVLAVPAVAISLALPATALAASPFTPGLPSTSTSTTTAPPVQPVTSTSPTDTGLSGTGIVAIAIGAIVVIGGIGFFIWRDARRRAPTRGRLSAATAGPGGRPGSKQRAKPRKLSPAERRRRKRGRAKR